MKSSGCSPDVVTYTSMLDAYTAAGKMNFEPLKYEDGFWKCMLE